MPAPADAAATRDGEALRFSGALLRTHVPALLRAMPPLQGVHTLDLAAVTALDSAGVALLAEVVARTGGAATIHAAAGELAADLDQLRAAYRLDASLQFAG